MTQTDTGLIEAPELAARLAQPNHRVRVIDATYGEAARDGFMRGRIGDAVFFDIEEIADTDSPLPHMLPTPLAFAAAVERLGVSDGDLVVAYDQGGMAMAAARAWWMFRVFGHDNVRVLNGGLPAWQAAGLPVNALPPKPSAPGHFTAGFRQALVRNRYDVQSAVNDKTALILDARSAARFTGQAPEPRPGLRAGHIPGSVNLPYAALLDKAQKMKPTQTVANLFKTVPADRPVIASCGSGVTACVLALGLFGLGRADVAVYDGSWSEWGLEDLGLPVE